MPNKQTDAKEEGHTLSENINTPFSNEHFASFCLKMVGQPYWYGCCLYKCTSDKLASKSKQYPGYYGSDRTARYKDDIAKKKVAADCVGACKGYAWTNGAQGVLEAIGTDQTYSSKYGSNGCPDQSANGMFEYAKKKGMEWGAISTLPDVAGLALHKDGHVGYTVGGGYAVDWRGFSYGCVKTKIDGRGWTHWYQLPFIRYAQDVSGTAPDTAQESDKTSEAPSSPTSTLTLGSRTLKKGMKGADVKVLQQLLLQLGYALPKYGADGSYGSETESAVRRFQQVSSLTVDGRYGEQTHKALMNAVAEDDRSEENPGSEAETDAPSEQPPADTPTEGAGLRVQVVASSGRVNIRTGNSTAYSRVTAVNPGTVLEWVATAANGWHAVKVGGRIGWISGAYSKRI